MFLTPQADRSQQPTYEVESALFDRGYDIIVGIDEVGRGSLAGPVMLGAAAMKAPQDRSVADANCTSGTHHSSANGHVSVDSHVAVEDHVVDEGCSAADRHASVEGYDIPEGLRDSKLLSAHRRQSLVTSLKQWAFAYAVGQSTNAEIDEWGIAHALGIAALRALASLQQALYERGQLRDSMAVILDGPNDFITKAHHSFHAPSLRVAPDVYTLVKADRRSVCVACASVLAKVQRDEYMIALSKSNKQFAPYRWQDNKGYGSLAHRQAIAQFGPSALHRLSWHLTDEPTVDRSASTKVVSNNDQAVQLDLFAFRDASQAAHQDASRGGAHDSQDGHQQCVYTSGR